MSGLKNMFKLNLKRKHAIIILCSIAAVLVLLFAALYRMLSGESARELYFKAESRNFKKYSEDLNQIYGNFHAKQAPYMNSRYRRRTEFTLDITHGGKDVQFFNGVNAGAILDIARNSKLIVDSRHDPAANQSLGKVSLLVQRTPLIDAEVYTKDRELGFAVPVIAPDKYFLLSLDKLDSVYDKFGISFRPKRLIKQVDLDKAIFYSAEEVERLAEKYGALMSGFIDEEDVKYGEEVKVRVGGEERNGREILLSLDKNKTQKLFAALLDEASRDDVLLRITYGNLAGVSGLLNEAGFFQLFDVIEDAGLLSLNENIKSILNHMNIADDLETFKKKIMEAKQKIEFPGGFEMRVVVDKDGNILTRDLSLPFTDVKNEKQYELNVTSGTNDLKNQGFRNVFCRISLGYEGADGEKRMNLYEVNSRLEQLSKNKDEKGSVELKYEKSRNGETEFAVAAVFNIDRHMDEATQKKNNSILYDITFQGDRPDLKDRFYGELAWKEGRNNKLKTLNVDAALTVNMDLATLNVENAVIKLNAVREDRFDIEEFRLPDMQEFAVVRLDSISEGELAELEKEIMASFGKFYLSNKPLFDSIMGQ